MKKTCPRDNIKELNLRNLQLEGDLNLEGFSNLRINVSSNPRLGKIKNKSEAVLTYQNIQEWLNHQYPDREKVKEIELCDFEQSSELVLDNYPNLKKNKRRLCL